MLPFGPMPLEGKRPVYGTLYIKNLIEEVRGMPEAHKIIEFLKRLIPYSSNYEFSIRYRDKRTFCQSRPRSLVFRPFGKGD